MYPAQHEGVANGIVSREGFANREKPKPDKLASALPIRLGRTTWSPHNRRIVQSGTCCQPLLWLPVHRLVVTPGRVA